MIQNVSYNDGGIGFNPYAAVNGVMNDIAHTSDSPNAYIQFAFFSPINLSRIVITNRADCCKERMIGTEVQTSLQYPFNAYTKVAINSTRDNYTISYTPNNMPTLVSLPPPGLETAFAMGGIPQANFAQYLRHLQNKNFLLY